VETRESQKYSIESVKRAIAILRSFSRTKSELGVTELSRELSVHKSTVSRLLSTLESEGFVSRNPDTGRYRLGVGLLELAGLVIIHTDLRRVARPLLAQLAEQTLETVNLAVRDHNRVINIELIPSRDRRILNVGWVGRHTPLHVSSTGKVFLAHLSEIELTALLQETLERFTEHTVTDPQMLREELSIIRERGFATGFEELEIGLNAVGAPIRDHTGNVIAAVSTAGPAYRLSRDHILEKVADDVVNCALDISHALGYYTETNKDDS
jgi:IclR family acetate operon transcriptional repressor